jgi:hypothetical protein
MPKEREIQTHSRLMGDLRKARSGRATRRPIQSEGHSASPHRPFFSLCTSCMGRLNHLKMTLPVSLSHDCAEILLVDYSCPEGAGDWAEQTFPAEVQTGRLRVIRVPARPEYHHSHAKNVTHVRAQGAVLINADADNFIDKVYLDRCVEFFDDPLVQVVRPAPWDSSATSGMMGRMALRRSAFVALGGYDEDMTGWGSDDNDLLRRAFALGLHVKSVPHEYLRVIEHDDALRTRYMRQRHLHETAEWNANLTFAKISRGEVVANLGRTIGAI